MLRSALIAAGITALISPGPFWAFGPIGGSIVSVTVFLLLLAILWDAHKATTRF